MTILKSDETGVYLFERSFISLFCIICTKYLLFCFIIGRGMFWSMSFYRQVHDVHCTFMEVSEATLFVVHVKSGKLHDNLTTCLQNSQLLRRHKVYPLPNCNNFRSATLDKILQQNRGLYNMSIISIACLYLKTFQHLAAQCRI